jgi:ketosteroid isomerase-like protein
MRFVTKALSLIAPVLLLLVSAHSAHSQQPQSALKAELQDLMTKMDRAMVNGDDEAVLAFYADDAVLLPNNAPKIVGKAALRKQMREHRKMGISFGSFTGTVDQAWECGGMVYAVGTYAMSANIPGLARPVGDKGKSLAIFRRTSGGKLQIVYDMWNTDVEAGK